MKSGAEGSPAVYRIAVRELCEFAAKRGDLDHRFTPSPSAQQGIAGHRVVAARHASGRLNERAVADQFGALMVRGRVDGFYPDRGVLEEVKTHRGDIARMPANHRTLHWAQAKVYAAMLCKELALPELEVSLVYFEISSQQETTFVERCSADVLSQFFEDLCETFLAWGVQEIAHRRCRDEALAGLRFPHASYRPGQRELAENVFRAVRHGRCLMAEAPTGIGKTLATLFPMLKACATEGLDKVFFLTAKGSGQQLATDAIQLLRVAAPGLPLRVIEIVSREKACEHPDKDCHGESCALARGFYDRLAGARTEAISRGANLTRNSLRDVARLHAVCPYYLTQELVRWADVVVADYNYVFDTTAALHLLTLANDWKVALLVDEAHNLVDRARLMYSGELSQSTLRAVSRTASSELKHPLERLARAWGSIARAQRVPYAVLDAIPERFASCLADLVSAVNHALAESPGDVDEALLRFYFDAVHVQRLIDSFGTHSMIDSTLEVASTSRSLPSSTLCIRNVVPATFLRSRYAAAVTTVMFSATLTPQPYYVDMLGLPADVGWLVVDPPFSPSQLTVRVSAVSTRFADRGASLEPIARLIARQYDRAPGNYLAFFSSFDYLERVSKALAVLCPQVSQWVQVRGQVEHERAEFLKRFQADGRGIGFAVLGGSFGEGIDLPGTRLIGAFVATLGLPQVNPVNEALRTRLEGTFGSGYEYAYLYPGIRKVVQAAGRVIRSAEDRGVLVLIDERFKQHRIRTLLPSWWAVDVKASAAASPRMVTAPSSDTDKPTLPAASS